MIILRNTIINNSLERSSFSIWGVTEEHNIDLRLSTIVRAFNRYLFLMKDIFHVSSKMYVVTSAVLPSCPFS